MQGKCNPQIFVYCVRYGHTVVENEGYLLFIGGADATGATLDNIVRFDLETNKVVEQIRWRFENICSFTLA